uniref:Unannotated protein n=1 Tax=freshwater metagenome TaxID=449393 RepID=A0A6J5ZZA6_9ZZZZ
MTFHVNDFVQLLDHVDGNSDRSPLVGNRAGHGLTDPPGRVGRELVTATVIELLNSANQPKRALLNQVKEGQAAAEIALGDRNNEPQIRFDHVLFGVHVAALDALCKRHLLHCAQQRHAADRSQVEAQRIEARLDCQVDLVCLAARRALPAPRRALRHRRRGTVFALCRHEVDPHLLKVSMQFLNLLLGDLDLLETLGDLRDGQEPLLLP